MFIIAGVQPSFQQCVCVCVGGGGTSSVIPVSIDRFDF